MNKHLLLMATLLAALAGPVHAQATTSADPGVEARNARVAADKAYAEKTEALEMQRKEKIKAAGDEAAADAQAKGGDTGKARRSAEASVKAATKAEYDAELKAAKRERDMANSDIKRKYRGVKS